MSSSHTIPHSIADKESKAVETIFDENSSEPAISLCHKLEFESIKNHTAEPCSAGKAQGT